MHTEKGVKYLVLVLEYCSGGSLESFIPSHELDLVDRLAWAIDIAKGIEYLHQNKVIHRDIKPENIMLSRGRAKIGDLGISKYLGEEDPSDSRRLGSFWYASPETL
jgi:serine/threonine protein kinase